MKSYNVIQQKTFAFSLKVIEVYKLLIDKNEFVLSKQLLRSGTSIGANIEESIGGQTMKDFLSKISIAYKEARETIYWLKLLHAANYLDNECSSQMLKLAEEICKILGTIQLTVKRNS